MTVSKNPPLTEDQIRQSAEAEAEARHAAAQASRHAQLDYMIAQQRQQQVAAALETIFGSEEDRLGEHSGRQELLSIAAWPPPGATIGPADR